jgi:hypothetical protein
MVFYLVMVLQGCSGRDVEANATRQECSEAGDAALAELRNETVFLEFESEKNWKVV